MRLGIFAKTFLRPSLEEVLSTVAQHRYSTIQFNFASAGLESLPSAIDQATLDWIGGCLDAYELSVAAVSGTFNMAHPESAQRQEGLRRLEVVARSCGSLGTSVMTLCSGTRDPHDMWRAHPDNNSESAWNDLAATMECALSVAEQYQVSLAFEPEQGNVVNSAAKAKRLLDTFSSPYLGVVLDAANLLCPGDLPQMRQIIADAIDLLGDHILLAHAKDLDAHANSGFLAPGEGVLDFAYFFQRLRRVGFDGSVVAHGFPEKRAEVARAYLERHLNGGALEEGGPLSPVG